MAGLLQSRSLVMFGGKRPVWCCFILASLLLGWGDDLNGATAAVIQNSDGEGEEWKLVFGTDKGVFVMSESALANNGKNTTSMTLASSVSSSATTGTQVAFVTGKSVAVSCDATREEAYWRDASESEDVGKLDRTSMIHLHDDIHVLVDTGVRYLEVVAYDWIAKNVYLIDIKWRRILVCGAGTKLCSVLVKEMLGQPRSVALEPSQGLMFWTDWGKQPAVMRAGMDGRGATAIVSTDLKWPNGICVDIQQDVKKRRVFWTDAGLDTIESAYLDGSDRRIIVSEPGSHTFGIDVFGDRVFWSDWSNHTIESADKNTGLDKKNIYRSSIGVIYELVICHIDRQPIYRVDNPCENSGCSHICTLSFESGYRCVCPVGMILDGKKCVDSPKTPYLYVADGNRIKFTRFHSIGNDVFESVTIRGLNSITALTHNPTKNNSIILSDSIRKNIYGYDMSTGKLEALLVEGDIDEVVAMDVDPIGENLYWVDAGRQTLEVMSLRTKARAVIMTGVENPTDILVVPELGSIFISRDGVGGSIFYKCRLNGDGLSIFKRVGVQQPVVLTYDNDRIYWIDKLRMTMHSTLFSNGTTFDADITVDSPISGGVIFERQAYFLGLDLTAKELRLSTKVMARDFGRNSTLAVSRNMTSPKLQSLLSSHECSWENPQKKRCSHICLLKGDSPVGECRCPKGVRLEGDGETCVGTNSCPNSQFKCGDGSCIRGSFKCDGTPDCEGGEDELESLCGAGEGREKNTAAIGSRAIGGRISGAQDGDDEGKDSGGGNTLVIVLSVSTGLLVLILAAVAFVGYWLYKNNAIRTHVSLKGNKPVVYKNDLVQEDDSFL